MYEIKAEDFYEDFSKYREMLNLSNNLTKSKYYDKTNQILVK